MTEFGRVFARDEEAVAGVLLPRTEDRDGVREAPDHVGRGPPVRVVGSYFVWVLIASSALLKASTNCWSWLVIAAVSGAIVTVTGDALAVFRSSVTPGMTPEIVFVLLESGWPPFTVSML